MKESAGKLIREFEEGRYDEALKKLYASDLTKAQRMRYIKAIEEFKKLYGDDVSGIFSAPGRSEIGGNHTDHQNGKVLAASVDIDAIAVASRRDDNRIIINSKGYRPAELFCNDIMPKDKEKGTFISLIRGVLAGVFKKGFNTGGFEAYITSDVMSGSGLSSSAVIEILVGNIISFLFNDGAIPDIELSKIGQYAENNYFGKPCGLMDQVACSVGGLIKIDFNNPKIPEVTKLHTDFSGFKHKLCIVDTGGSHASLTSEYASIPYDMKKVAEFFGKEVLREVDEEELLRNLSDVRKYAGDRAILRAFHYFGENKRVEEQVDALCRSDFEAFKKLVRASGNSSYKFLQNVCTTKTVEEQSIALSLYLTERILGDDGCFRVHGGGFAGTVQSFVPDDKVSLYKKEIEKYFGEGACRVLNIRSSGGVKVNPV